MKSLPKLPHEFIVWWFYKLPYKIIRISSRFVQITSSQLSFGINFKYFFTPLFGDYTIVGRTVGLITRLGWFALSLVFLIAMTAVLSIATLVIVLSPVIIWIFLGPQYSLAFILMLYLLFIKQSSKIPPIRVSKNTKDAYYDSCRKEVLSIIETLYENQQLGLKKLFDSKSAETIFLRSEIDKEMLFEKLKNAPTVKPELIGESSFSVAQQYKSKYVEIEHLLLGLLNNVPKIDTVAASLGTSMKYVNGAVEWESEKRNERDKIFIWQDDYTPIFSGGFSKGMLGRITPKLDLASVDFTKEVLRGQYKKILGRDDEINKIAQILGGAKDNVLIIGAPGSGKTTLVRGVAQKILEGTEYSSLTNKRLVGLDISGFISGTSSPGMIAENLKKIMDEVVGSGDIILFIDEIHNLVASAGDSNAETSKVYSILEPYLSNDKIKFIGATTMSSFRKYIEPNGAFSRLFNTIEISETSKDVTVKILETKSDKLEQKSAVIITYPALYKIVELSEKLIHERVLPDKAIDILNRTFSRVENTSNFLKSEDVAKEVALMTHVPVASITQEESQKLLSIEDDMRKMVVGQDEALKQIATSLRRARAGIRNEDKPIASFLFIGTTGVGKTQTAKALAKIYFGDKRNMIRLDMSEYQQIDSINRLLGSPDGQNKGLLTEMIRSKPFTLLLLDEIEKAHPNILLAFLQVLDEGKLTDNTGTVIDFTNAIIIATSNVGTKSIQQVFAEHGTIEVMRDKALSDVREKFAPEFLNRFTGIIVFNPLTNENILQITKILLDEVSKMAEDKNIEIKFRQELIEELAEKGYSPEWGARPLARLIEDTVETYIATKILKKEINDGDRILLGTEVFNSV